ncbi:unnamed protein product [Cuscuta epithymum]|uniref:Uncharacterized protein n=1 Tax=Cuscuta epithymum TaxID=186058 RepID=A0AAV0E4M9_9ASTE|nr:unnamed protein product [Cuscuta epithymum]CAH9128364.1 unnamed protein product [Cuscuta epithymum]
MWARFRGPKSTIKKDAKPLNVDDEYARLSTEARQLHPWSLLFEPHKKNIATILDSIYTPGKSYSHDRHLKSLLNGYFEISTEAATLCDSLLKRINHVRSDYRHIQKVLIDERLSSNDIVSELRSLSLLFEPPFFDNPKFTWVHDEHSSMLQKQQHLGCGGNNKNKWWSRKVELATKGSYIVKRDLEIMSRLVWRVHDEIEHNKGMIKLCMKKREDNFSLQMVLKALKNNNYGFEKQVEELQQHVYLCLFTINRVKVLVIREILESKE